MLHSMVVWGKKLYSILIEAGIVHIRLAAHATNVYKPHLYSYANVFSQSVLTKCISADWRKRMTRTLYITFFRLLSLSINQDID